MSTAEFWSIVLNLVSVILAVLSIGLAVYFFLPASASSGRRGRVTYIVLAFAGTLVLAFVTPQTLAAVGVIGSDSLQGWATLVGLSLVVPVIVVFPTAAILSLIGLVRGPRGHRIRVLIWWMVGAGGTVLSEAMRSGAAFNPYLGTPQPALGPSDALLLVCLGLSVALPCAWVWRSARGYDTGCTMRGMRIAGGQASPRSECKTSRPQHPT